MKLTKKILVAVLAIACLASCFLFSSFADDQVAEPTNPFRAIGISKIDDILEYYTCEDYLADGYDDGEYTEAYFESDYIDYGGDDGWYNFDQEIEVEIVADPTNPDNMVFRNGIGFDGTTKYARQSADGKAWTNKLFLTFDIYFDENCAKNIVYEVSLAAEGKVVPDPILRIDFRPFTDDFDSFDSQNGMYQPYVEYASWNSATGYFSTVQFANAVGTETPFVPETGKWYSVEVSYNAEDEVCFFTISEGDTVVVSQHLDIPNAHGVKGFECKATYDRWSDLGMWCEDEPYPEWSTKKANVFIDDMEIYEGSYTRYPAQKEDITRTTLQDLEALYLAADTSREDKILIAEVLYKLYNGVVDEDGNVIVYTIADDLRDTVPNAAKYYNETFAQEIVLRAPTVNPDPVDYYAREAYLKGEFLKFNELLPADEALAGLPGITPELESDVIAARAAYVAEIEILNIIKTHSETFVNAMTAYAADEDNKDYNYITDTYTDAASDAYDMRDAEYAGVAVANETFARLEFKYNRMITDLEYFNGMVDVMIEAEENRDFGSVYAAYQLAYKAYHKYADTHAGSRVNPDVNAATNAELDASVTYFEENEAYVLNVADECNKFINIVLQADIASYYPTFREILDEVPAFLLEVWGEEHDLDAALADELPATEEFTYRSTYKTVASAYATYLDLVNSITVIEDASAAYIAAVEAIADAEGFYAKKNAVLAAIALQAEGDNLAVPGVKEANLALTAAKAEVDQLEGNSTTFISVVNSIAKATTLAERKALILRARAIIDSVASDYSGIAKAITNLNNAAAAYEAEVAALNNALVSASGNIVTLR
ncbi:MAG: hypothetical protein J6Q69_01305 [Clostridia bacterium]|nr:hypothetical protein [Clostridia bacterium]